MIVPRVFKSRQRKRKNISIVLSSHKKPVIKPISGFFLFAFLRASGQSLQHFLLTLI